VDIRPEALAAPVESKDEPTPVPPRAFVAPDPPGTAEKTVPCGQRLALGPGSLLVVGKVAKLMPEAGQPGALLLIDRDTGRVLRTIPMPSEPLDVIVVPRE
jgi:hypothetical protein